jgi:hypothetical protein
MKKGELAQWWCNSIMDERYRWALAFIMGSVVVIFGLECLIYGIRVALAKIFG